MFFIIRKRPQEHDNNTKTTFIRMNIRLAL